jgi:hypothetical protein
MAGGSHDFTEYLMWAVEAVAHLLVSLSSLILDNCTRISSSRRSTSLSSRNCRIMTGNHAMTAPFYGWSAYQFIGTAPLPTRTATPIPSPSPTITTNPYGANACPNLSPTSYTISNTLCRYNFCMVYMAPGSVNMYAADALAFAAFC